jgi:protein phosphatase
MTLVLRYAARSDRGLVRQNNQDSVYAGPRLLALADGMGGHAAGEVASKVVIAALAPLDDDEPGDDLLSQLHDATAQGNSAISELVAGDPDLDGMGTTLTAVLFAGNRLGIAHIGDSRAYLMRDGQLTQITHDDTFVQSLIDEGRITAEEAASHPQRSLLLRALTGHDFEPSLNIREARPGDRYLLCSDGLSSVVSSETLAEALRIPDPRSCADRLIELALRGGGPDNVTCVVADVVDIDFGEHAPIVGGAAGDGSDEDNHRPDSAAARASATTLPRPATRRPAPSAPDPRAKRARRMRVLLVAAVVLVILAAAGVAGRVWVLRQYYVGATDDGRIVIYQGVTGSVFGIPFHRVAEGSCPPGTQGCEEISTSDLKPSTRLDVQHGIDNISSLDEARATVRRLRSEGLLPPCPAAGTTAPGGGPTGGQPETTTPTATTPAAPPTTTVPAPGQVVPSQVGQPGQTQPPADGAATVPEPTSLSTVPQEPGQTCRTVH